MNNIKTISKYTFLEQFFPYYPKKNVSNLPKSYPLRVLYLIFTYFIFVYFTLMISHSLGAVYLSQEGGEVMYFAMFGIVVTLTILIFYLPKMISTFFSTKDIKLYKTLPIGQADLFVGKLLGSVLSFVDFYIFFLVNMAVYIHFRGFSLSVLLLGILNFIGVIIIPYSILSLLLLVIMRFTNLGSHRKLFKNIGYIILFVIIGGVYYLSFNGGKSTGLGKEGQILSSVMGALASISNVFFSAKLYGQSLSAGPSHMLIYTLLIAAISIVLIFITYKLSGKIYYDAVSDGTAKKSTKKSVANTDFRQDSQVQAIFKRDIKNLFSNIVFLSQAIMMVIIFGVMTLTLGKDIIADMNLSQENMNIARFWAFFAGFGIGLLTWVNSGFAANDLSREHSSFYLFQTLPIDPKSHYKARFLANFTTSAVFALVLGLILAFGFGFGIEIGFMFIIGQLVSIYLATNLGLYLGSKNINTNWTKPEELSKGGVKGMIYYFLSLIYIGLLVGLYVFIMAITEASFAIAGLVVILIIVATIIPFRKLAIKAYKNGFYDV